MADNPGTNRFLGLRRLRESIMIVPNCRDLWYPQYPNAKHREHPHLWL
jgi:hypothetical protein